jgi:N-acetylneuraminate synthase
VSYGPTEVEKKSIQFRRSLYLVEELKAGDILTRENVRAIRPGLGLPPKYIDVLLGRRINQNAKKGTPLTWALLS